jgi:hypothetical protein
MKFLVSFFISIFVDEISSLITYRFFDFPQLIKLYSVFGAYFRIIGDFVVISRFKNNVF